MEKRPVVLAGSTRYVTTGCGNVYVTINIDEKGKPFEVFATLGKAGGCGAAQNEAIGRLVSGWLRCGGDVKEIIKMIKGINCYASDPKGGIHSCADAVAVALEGMEDGN